MYNNAWLDYHADAQAAKQELSRTYAKMVSTFGSYKKMPEGIKELMKKDYASHEAKWSENGTEMQKRFGTKEAEPAAEMTEDQTQKREEFLQNIRQQSQQSHTKTMEYEP